MDIVLEALPVLFNFIVVVLILYFSLRKMSAQFLSHRSETIAASIAEGEKLSVDAAKLLNEWDSKWKQCEAYSKSMMDEAKITIERLRSNGLDKAKLESERIAREGTMVAETEMVRVKSHLQREIALRSLVLSQNYLKKHLAEDDRKRLVNEYLEKVSNGNGG
jgi:F0F1-type ATP synthase membrane subunit b/b'